jgi:hypothetical protein
MREGATIGLLCAGVASLIARRGSGLHWQVEGNFMEAIDFDFCYPVVEFNPPPEIEVYIKQKKYVVKADENWYNVSERLRKEYKFPPGTLFRIFPIDMENERLDDEHHAYSFDWEAGKQYWFDIVRDPSKDRNDRYGREIRMVDPFGRVDTFVIPLNASIYEIRNLCSRLLEVPDSLMMDCVQRNDLEWNWGHREGSATPLISCTLISPSNRGNANVYEGSDTFKAEQIGRILGVRVPPFERCRTEGGAPHFTIYQPEEWFPIGLRAIREHDLVFQMNGVIIPTPKQIAFDRRVLRAEEQTSGINSGLGDFLQEMSLYESKPVYICVGTGHTMLGDV